MLQNQLNYKNIGVFRHFFAIVYDSILLCALLIMVSYLYFTVADYVFGYRIEQVNQGVIYQLYLFAWVYVYFVFPWQRRGQTLGMRTWKFRLSSQTDQSVSFKQANLRFFLALLSWLLLGLGFLWRFFNSQHLTLHDHFSGTYLSSDITDE
jgi:uncharacterized RDD family membrane protein YckC